MLDWSLQAFGACEEVAAIVVAVPPDLAEQEWSAVAAANPEVGVELRVLAGGATRAESVANALATVETELVAIHDAARPLVTPALIEALLGDLEANPAAAGAIAAHPVADTLKRVARAKTASTTKYGANAVLTVGETVDREGLWGAQTPQVFRAEALRGALAVSAAERDAATDEAMLVERAGGVVLLHQSEGENLKVTTAADLRMAELVLRARSEAL